MKIKAFGWQLILDRIPSRLNLWKRRIIEDEEGVKCVLCDSAVESIEHLIFSCNKSEQIWKLVYNWAGFDVVMPVDGKTHFLYHRGLVRGKNLKQMWMVLWFSTAWSIWIARNGIIFKQENFDVIQLVELIKFRAWNWFQFRGKGSNYSFSDWCMSPLVCMKSCI